MACARGFKRYGRLCCVTTLFRFAMVKIRSRDMKLKGNGVINHVLHLAEKRRISYVNEASSRLQLAGTQSGVLSSVPP